MTHWTELDPPRAPRFRRDDGSMLLRPPGSGSPRAFDSRDFGLGGPVAPDPDCLVCGRRMMALEGDQRGPVGWICVSEHLEGRGDTGVLTDPASQAPPIPPFELDDLLPGRTPADECIAEWERLGMSAGTAEHLEAFFSGANPEPTPPRAVPGSPDSGTRGAEGPTRVSVPTARAGTVRAVGFLEGCVRDVLARAPWPLTAFEIAREVLKGHPNRWAASSIERKVSQLAGRGVLRQVDCEGLSPDQAPCWRYELGVAA